MLLRWSCVPYPLCCANQYTEYFLSKRIISWSLKTFAMIDAALIAGIRSSPLMYVQTINQGNFLRNQKSVLPSIWSVICDRSTLEIIFVIQRTIALRIAHTIPCVSIYLAVLLPYDRMMSDCSSCANSVSLCFSDNFFESSKLLNSLALELLFHKITPTYTGHAKGHLPASSI